MGNNENDFDISQHTGGKDVTKARHLSCAIKCLIIIIIGILACVGLCIKNNQTLNNFLSVERNKFIFTVIGIVCIAVLAALGIIVPDKSEWMTKAFNFIELSFLKLFAKNHPAIKGNNKAAKNKAALEMLKAHPLSLPQKAGYFFIYVLAGILAVGIAYFYSDWFYSEKPPPPPPPAVTTTVPVTTVTDPVTEPTTSTVAVTETTPVTEPPETTPPTTKQTEPTDPPPTTTTDPLIYSDDYTYTYVSTLSNGEKTTETVVGRAIVGYADAERGSAVEIQTLDIPDDVAIIADDAFQYCIIHELHLGQNVQVIGQSAFSDDSDFDTVYLPGKLRYIGAQAFFSSHIVRTFYLNEGRYPFLDRMCFGTPDPFGRPDQIVIFETDGTSGYDPGECTAVILERIDALMHGTAELVF